MTLARSAGFTTEPRLGGLGAVGKAFQPQQVPTSQSNLQQGVNGLGISFGSNSGMESLWGPLSKQSSTSSFWNPHLAESDQVERVPDSLQVISVPLHTNARRAVVLLSAVLEF